MPPKKASEAPSSPFEPATPFGSPSKNIPAAHLTIGDELGKGQFKRVCRGRHKRRDVVVLKYSKSAPSKELEITLHLASKNRIFVPEVYGICVDKECTSVVQELAPFGTMKMVLNSEQLKPRFTVAHQLKTAAQIARAMDYLESENVTHGDLSCRNILLFRLEDDPAMTLAKVSDFGLSNMLEDGADFEHKKQPRAVRWCSPETILENKLSHRADVWSLGATLWEMFSGGQDPWVNRPKRADVNDQLKALAEGAGLGGGGGISGNEALAAVSDDFPRPQGCPAAAHATVLACLRPDEFQRLRFTQIAERMDRVNPQEEDEGQDGETSSGLVEADGARRNSKELQRKVSAIPGQVDGVPSTPRFMSLKAFLSGPTAKQALGEEKMMAMLSEILAFEEREGKLLLTLENLLDGKESPQVFEEEDVSPAKSAATPLSPLPSKSLSFQPAKVSSSPWIDTQSPRAAAAHMGLVRLQMGITRERSVLRSRTDISDPWYGAWAPWTLWTHHPALGLQRQDFTSEAESLDALQRTSGPCMLRDPSGAEVAARGWIATYYSMLSGQAPQVSQSSQAMGAPQGSQSSFSPKGMSPSFSPTYSPQMVCSWPVA